jgi:hypothetical protein
MGAKTCSKPALATDNFSVAPRSRQSREDVRVARPPRVTPFGAVVLSELLHDIRTEHATMLDNVGATRGSPPVAKMVENAHARVKLRPATWTNRCCNTRMVHRAHFVAGSCVRVASKGAREGSVAEFTRKVASTLRRLARRELD